MHEKQISDSTRASVAALLTRILVRTMDVCRPAEQLLLFLLRSFKAFQPAKGIWWRLPGEFARRAADGHPQLRWSHIPSSQVRIRLDINSLFGILHLDRKRYEEPTTDFICNTLKPGDVFVDIGANIGYFTLLAADLVGESGSILSFEPNPVPREMLQQSLARNDFADRVTLMSCALSNTDHTEAKLYLPVGAADPCIASIEPWQGHFDGGELNPDSTLGVELRTFDSIAKELSLDRIDLIKLDVEGAEMQALEGMRETIMRLQPKRIICEAHHGGSIERYLNSLGYTCEPIEYLNQAQKWGNLLFTLA